MAIPIDGKNMVNMMRGMMGGKSKGRRIDTECPECETDLYWLEPGVIHHDPMRKRIYCKECDKRGWLHLDDSGLDKFVEMTDSSSKSE